MPRGSLPRPVLLAAATLCVACGLVPVPPSSSVRGLLASPGMAGQPMKAVYFFPGEEGDNTGLYTTHPTDARDAHWNTDPAARAWVLDRMVAAHVNTVLVSYWGDMPEDSPMALDGSSLPALIEAAAWQPLVLLPAIESGDAWSFAEEFPTDILGRPAPGLVERIGAMVSLFQGHMDEWAQVYDRNGEARYAVNVILAHSDTLEVIDPEAPSRFAAGFAAVADQVMSRFGVRVGFTIDAAPGGTYSLDPVRDGVALEAAPEVLAIQSFEPEIWSGTIENSAPCPPGRACAPYDNNVDNLGRIADWKRTSTRAWVGTGVPVILSVSNGYDGRYVWGRYGAGVWGDNHDATDDRFRNWVSELKGSGVRGITFDTWNGYTEGYAAVDSVEHRGTVYRWLADLLKPDPRGCSHVQYADGAPTYRVYGSICKKWLRLGADRHFFGPPVSGELSSALGRVSHFRGGSIYWSGATHAHEVHGSIGDTYLAEGADGSCLGLPVDDERAMPGGRVSHFQHGVITWTGGRRGKVVCDDTAARPLQRAGG